MVKSTFELQGRRRFIRSSAALGLLAGLYRMMPAYAVETTGLKARSVGASEANGIDLLVRKETLEFGARRGTAVTINGTVPGPLVRLREGGDALIRVTNDLEEDTSIHWHGLLLPPGMDGVPGVSFAGIKAGETFTYRFPVRQNGTYWYHSHSGFQEQEGHYGPLIIDAAEPEPFQYDREHVVVLSDWTSEDPMRMLARLKRRPNYYNFQRRTLGTFLRDVATDGFKSTVTDRLEWARMRMDPSDISDVTGSTYTFLMNGFAPEANWTALFQPGERVRLRFINAGAGTYFDLRIPGLPMTVVSVDGQHVQPVIVDEIRIAIAETYDVIVAPKEARAYTIFAEAMDRSGFARGTLATETGMTAPLPPRRKRAVATMADMGMGDMAGMQGMKGAAGASALDATMPATMKGMDSAPPAADAMPGMPGMDMTAAPGSSDPAPNTGPIAHGPDHHGPGNSAVPVATKSRLREAGTGLEETGTRVLRYSDLRSLQPGEDTAFFLSAMAGPDRSPASCVLPISPGCARADMFSFAQARLVEQQAGNQEYHP